MNDHNGFHEYKNGKRFNPECLACLVKERDRLRKLYLLKIQMLKAGLKRE